MREISYTRDRRRRLVEFPPTPAHGPIYQVEALFAVAGGSIWKPIGRIMTSRGVPFAPAAWDAAHRAMITGKAPKALSETKH
jgi:hypothetical protein